VTDQHDAEAKSVAATATDGATDGAVAELHSRNPLARLPEERRMRFLLWAVLAVVITGAFMTAVSSDLEVEGRATIVEFELADSVERSGEILERWGVEGRQAALASLWSDYPFLISYTVALGLGALLVAQRMSERSWTLAARLGILLVWAALLAGILDAVENGFLISEMASGPTVRQVAGARVAALAKFFLVFLVLLYVIVGGLVTRFVVAGRD